MSYLAHFATFPPGFENDGASFALTQGSYTYILSGNGRLWRWDGSSVYLTLVADAPPGVIGMTDLAYRASAAEVWGTGIDGHLYAWNGSAPAVSQGGSGAWVDKTGIAPAAEQVWSVVSNTAGDMFAGPNVNGKLYQWDGVASLVQKAPTKDGEPIIHFLLSDGTNIYGSTGHNCLLFKWDGVSAWIRLTTTAQFEDQSEALTIAFDGSGNIWAATRNATEGTGALLKWNGVDDWELAYKGPYARGFHFLVWDSTEQVFYAVAYTDSILVRHDPATGETEELSSLPGVDSTGLFKSGGSYYVAGTNGVYKWIPTETGESEIESYKGDMKLFYGFNYMDIQISGQDVVRDGGLETAVIISLFSDRRAEATDVLPDNSNDRRGWWADNTFGSRLWLLGRSKTIGETLALAEQYAGEALAWMVDEGIADTVDITVTRYSMDSLLLSIQIIKPEADPVFFRFYFNWVEQLFRRVD